MSLRHQPWATSLLCSAEAGGEPAGSGAGAGSGSEPAPKPAGSKRGSDAASGVDAEAHAKVLAERDRLRAEKADADKALQAKLKAEADAEAERTRATQSKELDEARLRADSAEKQLRAAQVRSAFSGIKDEKFLELQEFRDALKLGDDGLLTEDGQAAVKAVREKYAYLFEESAGGAITTPVSGAGLRPAEGNWSAEDRKVFNMLQVQPGKHRDGAAWKAVGWTFGYGCDATPVLK